MPSKPLAMMMTLLVLTCIACEDKGERNSSSALQSRLDTFCTQRGKESLDPNEKLKRVEAFYSSQINTCVQVEVSQSEKDWSYGLRDVTNGFLRGPKLSKSERPLTVYVHDYGPNFARASAEGFWQSTESSSDKQLVAPIAAKIECNREDRMCRESDASVFVGLIQPESHEYRISSWTPDGIIANDTDEGTCGIGHRLSIDFKGNSVVVTDYPKKVSKDDSCKPFQTANSYALHGGTLGFMGMNQIFSCEGSGVNNAVVEKVTKLHGEVADKNYSLWMDNAEGGPPATMETPSQPYTQDRCERLMENKIIELKR
jgi:hypothetical protein